MDSTIAFAQELLSCAAGIHFSCVSLEKEAVFSFLQDRTNHIFNLQPDNRWQQRLSAHEQEDFIWEHTILNCIRFLSYIDKCADRVYLFGPVLTLPFSSENIADTMEQHAIPQEAQPLVLEFCSTLPVVSEHILYRTTDLVIRHLTGRDKPFHIRQGDMPSAPDGFLMGHNVSADENIAHMRQVEMRYEYSAALTDAIKRGNLSLALHMISQYSPSEQTAIRNTNPLRNAQNYCIVLNTQLRHALEESGIHPYRVDRLSNQIGIQIEQLKTLSEIPGFFNQIIRQYCRLVQEHTYPDLKPLANLAVTYIKEHLADNLTVKGTAKALTVNADYLSSLFHREVGMPFIDFVNRERTNQAAGLLRHTNLQIQQIASAVGYNNTSYFAKQFVRFQGISPSQYRRA